MTKVTVGKVEYELLARDAALIEVIKLLTEELRKSRLADGR